MFANLKNYHLVLASKSPRRQELLGHLVSKFETRLKEIDEVYPDSLPCSLVPEFLAELKAEAFKVDMSDEDLIITSDTIVHLNNKIYGKPVDKEDAVQILRELSGKKHEVITGVCLLSKEKKVVFSETTYVYFKDLSKQEIEFYVDNYQAFDKAGAYAIQEWIGMIGIEKIEGDYFNVVGLPLFRLNQALKDF